MGKGEEGKGPSRSLLLGLLLMLLLLRLLAGKGKAVLPPRCALTPKSTNPLLAHLQTPGSRVISTPPPTLAETFSSCARCLGDVL